MKTVRIFLASSAELTEHRREFELFIGRQNKLLVKRDLFLELVLWEDFLDTLSATRLQDEYNRALQQCELFVMLFRTKVGKYTAEEFERAFGQFKSTGRPLIWTYFNNAPVTTGQVNRADMNTLWDFQDKLKSLGHFQTVYENQDALCRHFGEQLDKLESDGLFATLAAAATSQFLVGNVDSKQVSQATAIPTSAASPQDSLAEQCKLVLNRLSQAHDFWTALCNDGWRQRKPVELADQNRFVNWLSTSTAEQAQETMFAVRRALGHVGKAEDVCRPAELAAVAMYCLAVCRLVDRQALSESYRFPANAGQAAHLYCAVIATVLCGGRLELSASNEGTRPRSQSTFEIRVPAAGDHSEQVFERAVFLALFADSPDATSVTIEDQPLTSAQRAKIKSRIKTVNHVHLQTLTLVVHADTQYTPADKFAQTYAVPVFVCDPDIADALIGMTAEELVADIEEMWGELRFCNRSAERPNPSASSSIGDNKMLADKSVQIHIHGGQSSVAVSTGDSSTTRSGSVHVGSDPRTEEAWRSIAQQIEEMQQLLAELPSAKARERLSEQIKEAETVAKDVPKTEAPSRLKTMLESIKSAGEIVDDGEKIVAACGKALSFLVPLLGN